MANEDHIRFEASFSELDQYVARAKGLLEEQLQKAVALGAEGTHLVSDIRSQLAQLQGAGGVGRTAPEIQRSTEAVQQENAALTEQRQLELFNLDVLRKQSEEYMRQRALVEARSQQALPGLGPAIGAAPLVSPATSTAAAERERALLATLQEETAMRRQGFVAEQETLAASREELAIRDAIAQRMAQAKSLGASAGAAGVPIPREAHGALMAPPAGVPSEQWGAAERGAARYQASLGLQEGLSQRAGLSNNELTASFTRLGIQENEASNALRAHGALTTEYLQALARGETTVSEFGYQVGATVGKFAGWTAAAGATYALLGGVAELGRGAIDGSTGVQQLERTIQNLNRTAASTGLQNLSAQTNVSMKEASDATFLYSRTFHNLDDALTAAHNGLSVFKLDNVSLTDSMQLSTSVFQQFGQTASQQTTMWNMLAAGQREYNARISQTVPLLRTATGAVHTAGGDLNQLIQLSVLAARIYPGMGGQIGTAFARGATTYTPKNLRDLQSRFGIGQGAEASNWTELLHHAIMASATMNQHERIALASDIFDPRFGSRVAGLFGPQAAATLAQISGRSQQAITPTSTRGALQHELGIELGASRERLHSFTNELQRMGAAIGTSGALSVFNTGLSAVIHTMEAGRSVADGFASLPGTMKEVVVGAELVGAALLFMSRTRFGSSVADLTRLSRLPGVGPSDTQRAQFTLRTGTRAAQDAVAGSIVQSNARLLTLEEQQNVLGAKRDAILGEEEAATAERNDLSLKIVALEREQTMLQAEREAQLRVQADLAQQQVMLRKRVGSTGGYSAEEFAALAAGSGIEAPVDSATGIVARTGSVVRQSGSAVKGLFSGLWGFANGPLDAFTVGMIGLPIALSLIGNKVQDLNNAMAAAKSASDAPINDLRSLESMSRALRSAGQREHAQTNPGPPPQNLLAPFTVASRGLGMLGAAVSGSYQKSQLDQIARSAQAQELGSLGVFYSTAAGVFQKDAVDLTRSLSGRQQLYAISAHMKAQMASLLSGSGLGKDQIAEVSQAFANSLQKSYEDNLSKAMRNPKTTMPSFLSDLQGQTAKWMQQQAQAYSDRADSFGLGGGDLSKAIGTYLYMAQAFRGNTDSTSLQSLRTAQGAIVSAVTKNVENWTKMAQSSTTSGGMSGDYAQALSVITSARSQLDRWVTEMEHAYKGNTQVIKAVQDAARQVNGQLNDQLKTVIADQLSVIKSRTALTTSRIGGISVESDIQRAQSALQGLREQLSQARASGADYQTVADLMTQINDAERALLKQQVDNARNVLDATGKLATSRITGISPAADLARAHSGLVNAQSLLGFDRSHGAGQAQILQDQAAVFDAERTLNEQIQQRSQQTSQDVAAFIDAEGALAESRMTNPIAIARTELETAIRSLATIKPQDYKTYQEYQTAVMQQQAKIGNARKSLTAQSVSTDMDTLKFELHTQRITDQQYIDGLNKLLQMKKLSQQDRQRILGEIYDTAHSAAVNLNTGNIRLPTTYEVRRAITSALQGGRAHVMGAQAVIQSSVVNHVSVTNHISVARDDQLKKVADVFTKTLRTHTTGIAQAAGQI